MVQKSTEEVTYHIGEKRMKKKIFKIIKIVVLGYVALQVILLLLCALLHHTSCQIFLKRFFLFYISYKVSVVPK